MINHIIDIITKSINYLSKIYRNLNQMKNFIKLINSISNTRLKKIKRYYI